MTTMSDTTTTQVDAPIGPTAFTARLRASADTCEELEEQLRIAKDRRNELIVRGYDDEGMTYGHIAKQTRLSRARIIAIIAAA